jgi:choice-of-anchor C domain-containing protein
MCTALALAPAAHASLIANGSFEAGGAACVAGATSLSGWTVSAGNIDIVSQSPTCVAAPAADGINFLDLTGSFGSGAGAIYQDIATVSGQAYSLTFAFGANSEWQYPPLYPNDGSIKSLNVLLDGVIAGTFSQDTTGRAAIDAGWTSELVEFTASSSTTRLAFESLNGAGGTVYGPFLDNVSVQPVPLPAAAWLLLSGVGGLATWAGRRKAKA